MRREHAYFALAVIGAITPWVGFGRYFATSEATQFMNALFANGASTGFTIDLLISSLVFWIFLFERSSNGRLDHPWAYVALNLLVGLSCAFPLSLWRMEQLRSHHG